MPVATLIYERLVRALAPLGVVIRTSETSSVDSDPSISSGSGAPSATEPSGSVYLRVASGTNGGAYQRRNSGWRRLADDTSTAAAAGTGNTGSSTASITESAPDYRMQAVNNIPASAVAIIAQQNTTFDVTSMGSITQPTVPRNVEVVFSGTWDGGNVEITGVSMTGAVSETVAAAAGTTVQSVHAFHTITRVRCLGTRTAGTVDVQTGARIGVPVGAATATLVKVIETSADGDITGTSSLSANGVLTLPGGSVPNGTKDYVVAYTLAKTFTDAGHVHTGPSHTHTITA